ncbi:MAG TPA: protein translocase subunit SecD [Solirubrobacteraceae bacterium]|nr:protein translocase subunit SecD [Solirubrobacteraceae bacterium]
MTDRRRNLFILLLVVGLIAGSAAAIAAKTTFLGLDLKGGVELTYQGEKTPQSNVTPAALQRAVDIMQNRVNQLGVSQPEISTYGGKDIIVDLPDVTDTARAEQEVGNTARLLFYDWEANALTPCTSTQSVATCKPQPVSSLLQAQDQTATQISQGSSSTGPGSPGEGSTDLYTALKTAEAYKNPPVGKENSRSGPLFYLFAAPGSAACQAAAKHYGYLPVAGVHCYVNGPDTSISDLYNGLPAGVSRSQTELMTLPAGTVVVQAVPANLSKPPSQESPATQWYTMIDNVALQGSQVTNPQAGTAQGGQPDVTFSFTSGGQTQFEKVTGQIAHRGSLDSGLGTKLYQHFAVALDNELLTVPYINFDTDPDGIIGGSSEIDGNFTLQTAQNLATQLRLGALPIKLKLISTEQISASLGKQALHQGLIAGLIGLIVVALFLVAYYRVLGVIATTALIIYAVYFFALIKLIPITLTLAGIAGLILTIGVAADANIVIFERVKEEVRAGRSIRQAIITGYKKGLTAIIDANVVTIMTAFILFVLATQDVKGLAFTLGVGVLVSLFTAVLATQAILMTMGDSRTIARPSALGASGKKHVWKIDFMGKSKYFFSLSGCILLIGALAIGGRGLNLGIDFTSGTQVSVGLQHSATQAQVTSYIESIGVQQPTVIKVSGKSTGLGPNGFQLSYNKFPGGSQAKLQTDLEKKFGILDNGARFNYNSVGPTFGSQVTHSAVVAIIISLLVISLYIALRFEWKFSVPVLIALMHDLLITSGVYALTGRTVTADTVAALLTILGYSLYDTIIVFDRVRENIPRMPRAAFSQIVNRSMSEVLTRSLATTSCTLLPIIALLLFGGSTLKDFAFALLIGVASGAYSSIFIASPVLTHWKERESGYRARRRRIEEDLGTVPPYAGGGADVEPDRKKQARRTGRLTMPDPDGVSAAEFEQMKRDLEIEETARAGRTSRLTQRLAHTDEEPAAPAPARGRARGQTKPPPAAKPKPAPTAKPKPAPTAETEPDEPELTDEPELADTPAAQNGDSDEHFSAPDAAENDGMVQAPKPRPGGPARRAKSRNRRHGRR